MTPKEILSNFDKELTDVQSRRLQDDFFVQNDVVVLWEKRLNYVQTDLIIKTANGWKYMYDNTRTVEHDKDYAFLFHTDTDNTYASI